MEAPGIDPGTSRMLSERSTIWATPPYSCRSPVFGLHWINYRLVGCEPKTFYLTRTHPLAHSNPRCTDSFPTGLLSRSESCALQFCVQVTSFRRNPRPPCSSTLKKEATISSESLLHTYQSTGHHIQSHCRQTAKFHWTSFTNRTTPLNLHATVSFNGKRL